MSAARKEARARLDAAIDRLASLFPTGHLDAASMGYPLLEEAADEIERLRAMAEAARALLADSEDRPGITWTQSADIVALRAALDRVERGPAPQERAP